MKYKISFTDKDGNWGEMTWNCSGLSEVKRKLKEYIKSWDLAPISDLEVKEVVFIKDWYTQEYPTDELGVEINSEATFEGLFETLDRRKDVYNYIGVGDSIVRERAFRKLAEIIGADYQYIYEQWLLCDE